MYIWKRHCLMDFQQATFDCRVAIKMISVCNVKPGLSFTPRLFDGATISVLDYHSWW